ncbi:MAG: hypothetical protein ACR2HO_11365 [Rubrobacteraceae bacterium]|jgi:hypothetical protein|nr:hypothetical protein [Rubrobacter sp.]
MEADAGDTKISPDRPEDARRVPWPGAEQQTERHSQEDRDQDGGVLRASSGVSGILMAGLVIVVIF